MLSTLHLESQPSGSINEVLTSCLGHLRGVRMKAKGTRSATGSRLQPYDDSYPDETNFEQYHVFITQEEDKRNDLWYEAEVNACSALPYQKQNSCVSVPFPGSVDSTTVQNK
jgi:hypothetical protein